MFIEDVPSREQVNQNISPNTNDSVPKGEDSQEIKKLGIKISEKFS